MSADSSFRPSSKESKHVKGPILQTLSRTVRLLVGSEFQVEYPSGPNICCIIHEYLRTLLTLLEMVGGREHVQMKHSYANEVELTD